MKRRRDFGRVYWTRERVLEGLREFYEATGEAPTYSVRYFYLTRTGRCGPRRRFYPSVATVWRYFRSFREAFSAAGVPMDRHKERWTVEEDSFIIQHVAIMTDAEIALVLRRTEAAVQNRRGQLGVHRLYGNPYHDTLGHFASRQREGVRCP